MAQELSKSIYTKEIKDREIYIAYKDQCFRYKVIDSKTVTEVVKELNSNQVIKY